MGQRWLISANVGPYQPTSRFLHFFFLVGTALCRGERGELGERELCIMAPDKPHDNVWKHLLERNPLHVLGYQISIADIDSLQILRLTKHPLIMPHIEGMKF